MEFELFQWGDGTIRLSFEDRIEGKDRHFILLEDGTVEEATENESGEETRAPVNLAIELRNMLAARSTQAG